MAENTVKVRVAVAVDAEGWWCAAGAKELSEFMTKHRAADGCGPVRNLFWLIADLPLPTEPEVAASVEGEG